MEIIIYLLLVFVIFLSIGDVNFFEHYGEQYKIPKYLEEYREPSIIRSGDKKCKYQNLVNGICFASQDECTQECKKYSSPGLQKNNYCINNYGEYVCYPSTW